jgi:hypothetical protein
MSASRPITVVVPARNAASTIGRALDSVPGDVVREIVLVDHACGDRTVRVARERAGVPLRVVAAPASVHLGAVRQIGLEAVRTDLLVWLDADDELLPGRLERMVDRLEQGDDLVVDAAELRSADGTTVVSPIPRFLTATAMPVRLFERNYLPAPGPIGARTASLRRVGYDPALHGPEDTDLLLRAIVLGLRFGFVDEPGYRIHAQPGSVSRNRARQRAMYRRLLLKHDPADVEARCRRAGLSEALTGWVLVSFLTFRDEYAAALERLQAIEPLVDPGRVLEASGPCPHVEGWRLAFHRGTLHLLVGRIADACRELGHADALAATPETKNNLGVALRRLGRLDDATAAFASAVRAWPGYVDAVQNLARPDAAEVTTHPLRTAGYRSDYAARLDRSA